jgi:hypothetical protein
VEIGQHLTADGGQMEPGWGHPSWWPLGRRSSAALYFLWGPIFDSNTVVVALPDTGLDVSVEGADLGGQVGSGEFAKV